MKQRGFFDELALSKGAMSAKFGVAPFSVLDGRSGEWTRRKKQWLALGLQGELGRKPSDDDKYNVAFRKTLNKHGGMLRKHYQRVEMAKNLDLSDEEIAELTEWPEWNEEEDNRTGVSIFDPVLTELMYRWFNVPNGTIIDPFAGGSTRGVVAEMLGYKYTGIEVRHEQVEANQAQANSIDIKPNWITGNSIMLDLLLPKEQTFDMIFTCPPYYDRELYSNEKGDLSCHPTYEGFISWYMSIFKQAVKRLKENRFVAVVVGEIRDQKAGKYRNFVGDTVLVFEELGLHYFNEIIFMTRVGSLPLRAGRQFQIGRKIGKTHQNILVFYKGDPSKVGENWRGIEI